jgi:hypothetical protein
MMVKTPWTEEQVDNLNRWQRCGRVHPFTCAGDRADAAHKAYADEHGEDWGQLIATPTGWVCPVCSYTQDWAHDFMLELPPDSPFPVNLKGDG